MSVKRFSDTYYLGETPGDLFNRIAVRLTLGNTKATVYRNLYMKNRLDTHNITRERIIMLLGSIVNDFERRNVPISDITKRHLKEETKHVNTYDDLRYCIKRLRRIDNMAVRLMTELYEKVSYFCGRWRSPDCA